MAKQYRRYGLKALWATGAAMLAVGEGAIATPEVTPATSPVPTPTVAALAESLPGNGDFLPELSFAVPPTPGNGVENDLELTETPTPERVVTSTTSPAIAQSPSVANLSDVQPTDWAYTAVRELAETYGCLSGFPNGTFRGNRPISRFEFAAGLSACLDAVRALINRPGAGSSGRILQDIQTLERLQRDFVAEILPRIEALEAEAATLRSNQFSTTTRLFGQVIFGLQGRTVNFADINPTNGIPTQRDPGSGFVTLYSSAQLSLLTQLSPRSLLLMGLQSGAGGGLIDTATGNQLGNTNDILLAYETPTNFNLQLGDLTYRQLLSDDFALIVGTLGVNPVGVFRGPNRIEGAGSGPVSRFAQRNPITSIGLGSAGVGFDWQMNNEWSLQGVYSAAFANNPLIGLFDGDYTLGLQLTGNPTRNLNFALSYLYHYTLTGNLGTLVGDSSIVAADPVTGQPPPLLTHAFGATLAYDLSRSLTLGGWAGYTTSTEPGEGGAVQTLNWMLFANFPDLFGEGHLGGIYIGQPPRIVSSNLRPGINVPGLQSGNPGLPGGQPGSTLHIEAFYRRQITNNISITPGVIVILNPGHKPSSDPIVIGVLRTTFSF